ncbi:phosphate signaling complex protein PhoU [Oceanobacillus sp. 143]|uniref:Phosphate-specific transport system accessory protein PhoU n=1 Tax=Oceanobacillus zhaokaii TaxID=2052660 RepID=A0A345PHI6_9BACI|nr:phosphate signaling complex protein PhoU [Oceanobacillus zhaokaii]AXI09466.1 phosphate transport system regulatory protein PhoU [Oceanobacillus zhaokaii]QGS68874.1 phosphate signaling complex protein PhoU [Oceanobacillus sp. 143]
MVTRDQFQQELEELDRNIIELARDAGEALKAAMDALYSQDSDLAKRIIEDDSKIDRKELDINNKAILLIAKQQPVATDLRRVIIVLRIVTDIERMADNAKNIARSAIHLGENMSTLPQGLRKMQEMTIEMLEAAILAFQKEDIVSAGKLAEMDDQVDKLYKKVVSELLGETATNPDKIQFVMQVAYCGRYVERFADHITNIGESILYLVKGENFNLN